MRLVDSAVAALRRRLLGISPEEIRYTIADVRREIRAVRAELEQEIAQLRRELDALPSRKGRAKAAEPPIADA